MDDLTPIARLTRDLANAAATLGPAEVRFLVDAYYQMQDGRIRAEGQIRSIKKGETGEPHIVLSWLSDQSRAMEGQIKRALDKYVGGHVMGEWFEGVYGVGPVISAGLLAHIDIEKAPTVGHIWRFAGLDPTLKWEKKTKRPWNAELKVLCWKAGQSFMKFSGQDECFYGKIYLENKARQVARNDRGEFSARASEILAEKNFNKATDAYKAYSMGRYPPAHIDAMARRYAVKLFLAHMHGEMCRRMLGHEPPLPYPIAHGDHVHVIDDPQR
jgi:hypothetical protein